MSTVIESKTKTRNSAETLQDPKPIFSFLTERFKTTTSTTHANITRHTLELGSLPNGQPLTTPMFTIEGQDQTAPTAYIQANIHGAEVQGNAVIYQLLKIFEHTQPLGNVTLVPFANPIGSTQKMGEYTYGRFDPITGKNWNRAYFYEPDFIEDFAKQHQHSDIPTLRNEFKARLTDQLHEKINDNPHGLSTGQHIAYRLQAIAQHADVVLDLHTGPQSAQHLYAAEYAIESTKHFNIANIVIVPNKFSGALDEACFCPWWDLATELKKLNRHDCDNLFEAFTVELGSQEQIDLTQAEADCESLLSYLTYKNIMPEKSYQAARITRRACYLKNFKIFYAPEGGLVEFIAPLGEILQAEQPLANLLNLNHYRPGTSLAVQTLSLPNDILPICHFSSASVYTGCELYWYFDEFFEID